MYVDECVKNALMIQVNRAPECIVRSKKVMCAIVEEKGVRLIRITRSEEAVDIGDHRRKQMH